MFIFANLVAKTRCCEFCCECACLWMLLLLSIVMQQSICMNMSLYMHCRESSTASAERGVCPGYWHQGRRRRYWQRQQRRHAQMGHVNSERCAAARVCAAILHDVNPAAFIAHFTPFAWPAAQRPIASQRPQAALSKPSTFPKKNAARSASAAKSAAA